jgi:hypothetical protein
MTVDVSFDHAFAIERAVRAFFASRGTPAIPCHEFCGRNPADTKAPLIWWVDPKHGRRHIVLPDLILIPTFEAVEIKTQGYAPVFYIANARTTGITRFHYESYRYYQEMTEKPLSIAFVHLHENEIRGGLLDALEPAKTRRVNIGANSQVYWEYDLLPEFFPGVSLSALLDAALLCDLSRDSYTKDDHARVLAYMKDAAIPNATKHKETWDPEIILPDADHEVPF